jgi:hypothetical protein
MFGFNFLIICNSFSYKKKWTNSPLNTWNHIKPTGLNFSLINPLTTPYSLIICTWKLNYIFGSMWKICQSIEVMSFLKRYPDVRKWVRTFLLPILNRPRINSKKDHKSSFDKPKEYSIRNRKMWNVIVIYIL